MNFCLQGGNTDVRRSHIEDDPGGSERYPTRTLCRVHEVAKDGSGKKQSES